jgi:hypothetical protein
VNFAARVAEYAGQPIDSVLRRLPKAANEQLNRALEAAILNCLNLAIKSIKPTSKRLPSVQRASLLAGITGGVSGFFGTAALAVELPVTTTCCARSPISHAITARTCRRSKPAWLAWRCLHSDATAPESEWMSAITRRAPC